MPGPRRIRSAFSLIALMLVLSFVLYACGGAAGDDSAERIRELEEEVQRLQAALAAAGTEGDDPANGGDAPGDAPDPGDGTAAAGTLPVDAAPAPGFRHEKFDDLPADVQAWAGVFRGSQAGVARTFGDRTYVLVAYDQAGSDDHRIYIENVYLAPGFDGAYEVIVVANVAHVADPAHAAPAAVASIDAVDIDPARLRFDVIDRSLPRVFNAHGLPDVALPADATVVVIEPTPGAEVASSFSVRGYARNLFEANLVARVIGGSGEVVLEQPTTAAACCFDWGSFDLPLEVDLAAGAEFTLELGDYDMAEGAWSAWLRMPLRVAR